MSSLISGRRGRYAASAVAAVLLAGGAATVGVGLHPGADAAPPAAPVTAAAATPSPAGTATASTAPSTAAVSPSAVPSPSVVPSAPVAGPVLPASAPVTLDVPEIGVHTSLLKLGKAADGAAAVPPGEAGSPAGWYKYSPTPGAVGPSVILGHVNSTTSNIGVFYRLRELKPGQTFSVTRADHTVAVFQVDRLADFHKDTFPTLEVYGNTNRAEIRLITCGGYNPATNLYDDNTVVYAHLTSHHPA